LLPLFVLLDSNPVIRKDFNALHSLTYVHWRKSRKEYIQMPIINGMRLIVVLILALCSDVASGMEMRVEGDRIFLTGRIESELDAQKFLSLITPEIRIVFLRNSPGGHTGAGLDIAWWIRSKRFITVASGYCNSSCANIFMGGVERYIADQKSSVGFHGSYDRFGRNRQHRSAMKTWDHYVESSGGKMSGDLFEIWRQLPQKGFIYFYKTRTYLCEGSEARRPRDCKTLPHTALDQGVITSLEDFPLKLD
jgi:hypothetical protein